MKIRLSLLIACAVMLIAATAIATPAMAHDSYRDQPASNYSMWGHDDTQSQTASRVPPELILVGVIVLIVVLRRIVPLIGGVRSNAVEGTPVDYGLAGGAICPRCGRTFARNLLSPNLLVGKLSRCPHCGKWSVVAAASPTALAEAEAAQRGSPEATDASSSSAEKLRRQIEDSKYEH